MKRCGMTRWIISALLGGALGVTTLAWAHGDAGTPELVTGEVVDLACYIDHGAKGAGHLGCASHCIASGLPVGIKSGDIIYLAIGNEHQTANATLAPFASQQVVVEGTVTERDGVRLIEITKVTAKKA